jgi:hypothetical protein
MFNVPCALDRMRTLGYSKIMWNVSGVYETGADGLIEYITRRRHLPDSTGKLSSVLSNLGTLLTSSQNELIVLLDPIHIDVVCMYQRESMKNSLSVANVSSSTLHMVSDLI